jgi:endo-1,4-beta-xylanase
MFMRGHTLAAPQGVPAWLSEGTFTREELMAILREHIQTVVGRYRGQIAVWDVVNEALAGTADGSLRDYFWLRAIGPTYIDLAFRWANEADPAARLFYNEFFAEGRGPKSDRVYELVRDLRGRGVPAHGVGMQMHIEEEGRPSPQRPIPQEVATNMDRLAALGLTVHVTEMDVRVGQNAGQAQLESQARMYADILRVCLAAPTCEALVTWGVSDLHSWLRVPPQSQPWEQPLLFDDTYRPKPAYYAVRDILAGGGSPTPPVLTPTRAPATSTPTASPGTGVGGRAFTLRATSNGTVLAWQGGMLQAGYVIARFSAAGATLLPPVPLPASATSFTDPSTSTGAACYLLLPLGSSGALGNSDLLCVVSNTRSGGGAPRDIAISLNQTSTATLTWLPPVSGATAYLLVPSSGPPISLAGTATGASHSLAGPTCYAVFAFSGPSFVGNSDLVCGIPGLSSL